MTIISKVRRQLPMYPEHDRCPRVGGKAARTSDVEVETLKLILLQLRARREVGGYTE